MKMRSFGILIFMTVWVNIHAQVDRPCTYMVKGIVKDRNTSEPLIYADILIKGTNRGTTTDENGRFAMDGICEKEIDLIFSYVGYKSVEHHHDYHHAAVEVFLVPNQMTLESVIIEAEHHAGDLNTSNSQKINLAQLPNLGTESLGEIVSNLSGINTISTGQNVVKPMIHGLHSNRILIVNEGLRHEFQNWGADHAPEIDGSLIENIEVIKGAATVRYGPDALGGVIVIKPPSLKLSSPLQADVRLTGKTNGKSGEASVKLEKGYKWISGMLAASTVKQGDLHTPDYLLTNTGKDEISYQAGIRLHPLPELDLEFLGSHFEQTLGVLRGSVNSNLDDLLLALEAEVPNFTMPFSYKINAPNQSAQHDLLKASAKWIGPKQSFHLYFGYQVNKRQEFDVRKGNDLEIPNIDLQLTTRSLDAEWVHPVIGKMSGRLGVHLDQRSNINIEGTQTVPFVPNFEEKRFGVYVIESVDLGRNLLEAGLRVDLQEADIVGRQPNNVIYKNSIANQNMSGTIGLKHQINEETIFRTNLGTAWRPANIAELYRYGRHLSFLEYGLWRYEVNEKTDFITTQDILTQKERPVKNEIGYKWINTLEIEKEKTSWELVGYLNYIDSYIYSRPAGLTRTVRGTSPFYIYDQTDALFWGLDLSVDWQHHKNLDSEFRASYLWSQQVETGDKFVGQPPTKLSWKITAEWDRWAFLQELQLGTQLAYTFKQNQHPRILSIDDLLNAYQTDLDLFVNDASDFDIAPPPGGYLLTDLFLHFAVRKVNVNISVRNLFNVRYRSYTDRLRYFSDQTGRNFVMTLSYKI